MKYSVVPELIIGESIRPYLHMYLHSNEIEEIGVISLDGVNVESDPQKEKLLGVRCTVAPDTLSLNPL